MFAIIGIVVVFGAIVGGYLMEHGHLAVLMQPAELLIIGGAAVGTVLIANPIHILNKIVERSVALFTGAKFTRRRYLETLKMIYRDAQHGATRRAAGALESDMEDPGESTMFSQYPEIHEKPSFLHFVCDTMRMAVTGGIEPSDLDQMMELDMEVHHHEANVPVAALATVADSLAGAGHCCRGAGRGDHHGRPGRAAGRDRPQSRRRPGGNLSRHSALLRLRRARWPPEMAKLADG